MNGQISIIDALFETQAIRVAPADQPFWYTSGTLGPYYINTHFLYGSEAEANQLLVDIEAAVKDPVHLTQQLSAQIMSQYQQQPIFQAVINQLVSSLAGYDFDFVSGGERRDYFFSIPVAALLNKPHLTLLKDGQAFLSDVNLQSAHLVVTGELKGQKAVHLADLVTEASSYTRTWLPALNRCGAIIQETAVVVDRDQGGREVLRQAGVELIALSRIDQHLFEQAKLKGLIDAQQAAQIALFSQDPHRYLVEFLAAHPDFLRKQVALGGKAEERARRCVEQGYGIL